MPCLIQKTSRCAADHISKTITCFIFHFLYNTQRFYKKIICIHLLFDWFSGENCILFTFFYTKDDRFWQIKKKHDLWNNRFSDCNWTWTHNHLVHKLTLNGWVFIYELSGCGFESNCGHLNVRFCVCFEQGVPWH